jgi:hypothetical protein
MTPYTTLSQHPRIMPRLVGPEPQLAIQLLTSARPDLLASNNHQTSATATILIWQGDEEHGIPAAWANLIACLFGWREPLLTTARSPPSRPSHQVALRHPARSGARGHRHRSASRQSAAGGGAKGHRHGSGGNRSDRWWH